MSKTYKVIAKISNDKFVKYDVNNLISFTKFLDEHYKDWRWFNVYNKKTKAQIISFTKYNKHKLKNTIHQKIIDELNLKIRGFA